MRKVQLTWTYVLGLLDSIDVAGAVVYGVPNGGMIAAGFLKRATVTNDPADATVILDDILDSGKTATTYIEKYPKAVFTVLVNKKIDGYAYLDWIEFPWETDHPNGIQSVEENITRIIQYIGEDANRSGIIETPSRVVKSYKTLFAGYAIDPESVFKIFDGEKYDEIVILKDIEFYSTCEHHMLPFYGKAHIAYIAQGNIIGVSKLARLLEVFTRRMQVQERIGMQVVQALDTYLTPLGSACIIEAKHLCVACRGVQKQSSAMVTSSVTGKFREDPMVRAELFSLIKL